MGNDMMTKAIEAIETATRQLKLVSANRPSKPWRYIARVGRRESVHTNEPSARKIAGKSGTVTAVYR